MAWQRKIDKSQIHPGLVAVMELTLKKLEEMKSPFKAYSGTRTFAQQNNLYAQGRTVGKKGGIVTKAKGGQSMHNYGVAVDAAPFNLLTNNPDDLWWPDPDQRKGEVWWKLEECLMEASHEIDEEFDDGLDYEWGGRWKGLRDVPHCQIRTTLTELRAGEYPYCSDVEWLVKAHTTFLFDTPWMARRMQHLLNMQSYSVGAVDGITGEKTSNALRQFAKDQKIEGNGGDIELDLKATIERLVRLHQTAMSTPRGTLPEELVG